MSNSIPTYYNVRQDTYYAYLIYALVFPYSGCDGDILNFKVAWILDELAYDSNICPFKNHEGDFEFAVLKFTKSGTFKDMTLSGQRDNFSKTYKRSQIAMSGSHPKIYVAKGTHSLYTSAGVFSSEIFLDELTCIDLFITEKCLGVKLAFDE